MVLEEALERGSFQKLYSYTTVLNAFTVKLTEHDQVSSVSTFPDFHFTLTMSSNALAFGIICGNLPPSPCRPNFWNRILTWCQWSGINYCRKQPHTPLNS